MTHLLDLLARTSCWICHSGLAAVWPPLGYSRLNATDGFNKGQLIAKAEKAGPDNSLPPTQALGSSMELLKDPLMITLSLLVLLVFTPAPKETRLETRSHTAFKDAQQIKAGTLSISTLDPWGMPFHITNDASQGLVVTSFGPNKSTGLHGFDDDDVSSAMSTPPHERMMRRQEMQMLTSFILSIAPWVYLFLRWCLSAKSTKGVRPT